MSAPASDAERAIAAGREGGPVDAALLAELAEARLVVPARQAESGGASLPVTERDGRRYVVAYTSSERQQTADAGGSALALTGRELARSLQPGVGIAINPGADLGVALDPPAVAVLAGGGQTLMAGTRVFVGEPADHPTDLVDALRRQLDAAAEVRAATLLWVYLEDGTPPHPLVVLDAGETVGSEARAALADRLLQAARGAYDGPVDIGFADEIGRSLGTALTDVAPFHERG